jgi:tetratricopeptide (TPR) repeat protein
MMKLRVLLFLAVTPLLTRSDEQQLALELRAQSDFDRVESPASPQLPDTARCAQSQAALLPVAPRTEIALVHFRKGYCELAGAAITGESHGFLEAAGEFEKAIEAWPDRIPHNAKNTVPGPVSSGLRILAAVARLKGQSDAGRLAPERQEIAAAVEPPACPADIMPVNLCQSLLQTGRLWLGWVAWQRDDLYQAAKDFSAQPETGWFHWAAGRQAFRDGKYKDAAAQYRQSVDFWTRAPQEQSGSLMARLAPQPDTALMLADLGGAELLSGEASAAITSMDAAIKADPNRARSIYLRARAKELAGQAEPALADYSLASRTAFANAQDLASGEAHLYRGIQMYRRKDYSHAEDEFSSALNFEITAPLRNDAAAWRHMAAVASGACTSRPYLEESLGQVSPYFPKDEARKLAAACRLNGGLELTGSAAR